MKYLMLGLLFCGGCMSSTRELIANLKDDHSNLSVTIVTPWGTQKIIRTNPTIGQPVKATAEEITSER